MSRLDEIKVRADAATDGPCRAHSTTTVTARAMAISTRASVTWPALAPSSPAPTPTRATPNRSIRRTNHDQDA